MIICLPLEAVILIDVYLPQKSFYFTKNAAPYTSTVPKDKYDKLSANHFILSTLVP